MVTKREKTIYNSWEVLLKEQPLAYAIITSTICVSLACGVLAALVFICVFLVKTLGPYSIFVFGFVGLVAMTSTLMYKDIKAGVYPE